jgi:hypothetical protein
MPLSKHRKKAFVETPIMTEQKKPIAVYIVVYAMVALMLVSLLSLFFIRSN